MLLMREDEHVDENNDLFLSDDDANEIEQHLRTPAQLDISTTPADTIQRT
jgi:hypothetical protein